MQPYYADEFVTLYHGDCREVLPQIASATVDFVLTDPPYLVGYSGRWDSEWGQIRGDKDPSWVRPVFSECWRVLKDDSLCVSFYGWPHADVFVGTWKAIGFRPLSHLIWVKNVWGLGYFTRGQHEQAYLLGKQEPAKPECPQSDVFWWERETSPVHPNQKPVATLTPLIERYAPYNAVVLDPFAGSGSSLVAAKLCGRHAVGMEIDERHCETAAGRLAQGVLFGAA